MFDLPSVTSQDLKQYRKFRNFLLSSGFFMMQESVYTKLALNQISAKKIVEKVRKNKPESGIVQAIVITEKQYSQIEVIVGSIKTDVVNTDERLVIL